MLQTWFASPVLLGTLLAIPAALAFFVFAHFRKKQMTARLSSPLLLRKSLLVRPRVRRWKAVCILIALALTAVACAGPQWGQDPDAQYRKGRDVIVVLDLSRSMFAEQPSRRELALWALRHLADAFEEHGGNRVALVAFAARAQLFFPLTQDADHLRHTLAQIEADDSPSLKVAEPISGTRIGAALKLAVDSCDPNRVHRPVIVLLTDGDDPAEDDEWLEGVSAAVEKQIRVHVVGIGSPDKAETIPVGRDLLQFDGAIVRTKLNEKRLREIARRTDGVYLPAYRETLPLGTFVLHLLDADELRAEPTSVTLPVYQLRYAWFLLPAAFLFMLTMLLNEGLRPVSRAPTPPIKARTKVPALLLVLTAILCISAADPPAVEALIRQGDEAFARQEYENALGLYEKAGGLSQDPGRVSFNKAAAFYRLERYKEAIECYRRCLEDDSSPAKRRARACFDLGNALLQQAGDDPRQLAEAVAAYRAALHLADAQSKWSAGARHNLELAQMLWLKARETQPEIKVIPKTEKPKTEPKDKEQKKNGSVLVPVDPVQGFKPENAKDGPAGHKSKNVHAGSIQVLLDNERVVPLSPGDTWATLADHARRIADARRQQRNLGGPAQLSTKDW